MEKETGDGKSLEEVFRLKVKPVKAGNSLALKLSHAKRRAIGIPVPGRQSHDRLCAFLKPKK
jgi:hypothetical protein